jgi:hypothetical protein
MGQHATKLRHVLEKHGFLTAIRNRIFGQTMYSLKCPSG